MAASPAFANNDNCEESGVTGDATTGSAWAEISAKGAGVGELGVVAGNSDGESDPGKKMEMKTQGRRSKDIVVKRR
uniref:Uncharacterized protein n=1 Tax=Peronospora matthiolae TaxID=2874970 RepID=A0AAV1T3Q2_9STRA